MTNVLFLHAHPDDEAIFTGGTIAQLSERGHEITVVFATGGELGLPNDEEKLEVIRKNEAQQACEILGVKNVHFLGFHDSGLDPTKFPTNALALSDADEAAKLLAGIMKDREIEVIFCDDENGIYGHPDHKACHEIAVKAADIHGLNCAIEFTVDGEHLHFVESHVVKDAFDAFGIDPGSSLYRDRSTRQHPGLTTVEITETVSVNGQHLKRKREAMAAHPSQIPADSAPLQYEDLDFQQVYGLEWFRHTPLHDAHKPIKTILDDLR